jgi:hypothetical protein
MGVLPVLTRVRSDVQTIDADGTLVTHHRPPTPAWFKEVGLDDGGRWEVFGDPVWLLTPPAGGRARIRLLRDVELTRLDEAAARRIAQLGEAVDVQRSAVDSATTRARWGRVLELSRNLLQGSAPA